MRYLWKRERKRVLLIKKCEKKKRNYMRTMKVIKRNFKIKH